MDKIYLNVPYSQKDDAKRRGAKWDAERKKWYVPSGKRLEPFEPWLLLFVEERQLTIELVPNTCWYSNVRSNVSKQDWDNLRHHTYKQASHRCEVCGGVGQQHPVECHEIWNYDDQQHIQTLTELIALCPACHECKHIGLAQIKDRGEIALQHLAKVNKWSLEQAEEYVSDCFKIWHRRSQFNWKLDISYLKQFGICTDVELDRNN
jgi:hypothetical protein